MSVIEKSCVNLAIISSLPDERSSPNLDPCRTLVGMHPDRSLIPGSSNSIHGVKAVPYRRRGSQKGCFHNFPEI